jgi:hypothetical protein
VIYLLDNNNNDRNENVRQNSKDDGLESRPGYGLFRMGR